MNTPLVSVIIPSYNRYDMLLNAIDSVKKQTYPNVEIIVVADVCEDKRYDLLKDDKSIVCIQIDKRAGNPCFARNTGIQKSKGEYVSLLDDDDMWLPNKLEVQIRAMLNEWAWFSCTEAYYSETDMVYDKTKKYQLYQGEHYHSFNKEHTGLDKLPKYMDFKFIREHNYLITSSVVLHKGLVNNVGEFVLGGVYVKFEDWSYWLRCLEKTDVLFIDEPLVFYNDTPREKFIIRR